MNILVVENDRAFREAWVSLLWKHHYSVVALDSLQDQTAELLHEQHYDLVLIDRRLRDKQDKYDTSGQEFAVQLGSLGTPTALVTSYLPNDFELFDLLQTGALTAVADKGMPMLELASCIEEFRQSRRFPNCIAKFYLKGESEVLTEEDWGTFGEGIRGVTLSGIELAVLFRSLIPTCALSVELEPLTPGYGDGTALFRARISSGDGPLVEEVAIKYGERVTITSEAMRYDRHVGPLAVGVAPQLRWRKETRKLGAIAYSWVGDSIEDGVPFGPVGKLTNTLTWRKRQSALERLFSVSLSPWYRVYRGGTTKLERPMRLLTYYTGKDGYSTQLPFESNPLPSGLPSIVEAEENFWDFGDYGKLPNPVEWLTKGPGSELQLRRYSPCHGDLHVKNIFVLVDDSPRLIDFGDTALGHVFRDFAALEVSVRLSCCNTTDLDKLKIASDCASKTKSLGEHIDHRAIPKNLDDLRKTLVTTMQIRRAALDAVGTNSAESGMKEYLFALIIRFLRYSIGIADEVSLGESELEKTTRLWHALYGAARATQQAIALSG
ncbi:MAG TPA: phosphotransferase [Pyrinomonadaceae bacterium]|nr:phosphotransferase [Pyrinomonadaceae bacterium]